MSIKRMCVGALAAAVVVVAGTTAASASGPLTVQQANPEGGALHASPFTWSGTQNGVALTARFAGLSQTVPGSLASVQGDFRFTAVASGAVAEVLSTATVNPDGSVTATAGPPDAPSLHTFTYPAPQATTSACWKCWAADAGAAAAAAAACIATDGIFCPIAAGAAAAAAAAYCDSNPCGGDNPSCGDSSWAGPYNDPNSPGYNLEVNSTVECSVSGNATMSDITMSYNVYQDGHLWYSDTYPTCYNTNTCGWSTFFYQAPTGHCYTNVLSWTGHFHNQATNEILTYGDSNVTSGNACI